MSTPIANYLLPMLVTGVIGVFVGVVLSSWRRGDAVQQEPTPSRWAEAVPETASAELPTAAAADRHWSRPNLPPPAADLLVVDDSAVARVKLRRLLEGAGYHVHLAGDGAEALAMLQVGRYALMLTDLEMPNMDGATLIDHCRRLPYTVQMPILAITGHENLRVKFNECRSISGVHRKPWIDDILLSHIAALAGSRHSPAQTASGCGTPDTRPGAAIASSVRTRPADLAAR
jgi:CheY-like chemotaxis protein